MYTHHMSEPKRHRPRVSITPDPKLWAALVKVEQREANRQRRRASMSTRIDSMIRRELHK